MKDKINLHVTSSYIVDVPERSVFMFLSVCLNELLQPLQLHDTGFGTGISLQVSPVQEYTSENFVTGFGFKIGPGNWSLVTPLHDHPLSILYYIFKVCSYNTRNFIIAKAFDP